MARSNYADLNAAVADWLTRADLDAATELFVTGSVRGIEPVRSLDGEAVGGPASPVAATLGAALRERWLG